MVYIAAMGHLLGRVTRLENLLASSPLHVGSSTGNTVSQTRLSDQLPRWNTLCHTIEPGDRIFSSMKGIANPILIFYILRLSGKDSRIDTRLPFFRRKASGRAVNKPPDHTNDVTPTRGQLDPCCGSKDG